LWMLAGHPDWWGEEEGPRAPPRCCLGVGGGRVVRGLCAALLGVGGRTVLRGRSRKGCSVDHRGVWLDQGAVNREDGSDDRQLS